MTYKQYLKSEKWQNIKKQVYDRARKNVGTDNRFGVCEACGYQPYKPCLQVHHRTYERIMNERLEDLILLCPRCHKAETEKQRQAKQANT